MPIRIITVEREYGSGGALIAKALAAHVGWKLWDEELSGEIARVAQVDPSEARHCDERVDPLLYRLFRTYARGSYERALPMGGSNQHFDADQMVRVLHEVIENIASDGNSIIVGRGAPYILRNRQDAFHVFIYASTEEKILRLRSIGKSESEARHLVEEIDRDRAAFIHHYFGKQWPHRPLYHLMLNSQFGDEFVVNAILHSVALINESYSPLRRTEY
jgi:cytidylate kinase